MIQLSPQSDPEAVRELGLLWESGAASHSGEHVLVSFEGPEDSIVLTPENKGATARLYLTGGNGPYKGFAFSASARRVISRDVEWRVSATARCVARNIVFQGNTSLFLNEIDGPMIYEGDTYFRGRASVEMVLANAERIDRDLVFDCGQPVTTAMVSNIAHMLTMMVSNGKENQSRESNAFRNVMDFYASRSGGSLPIPGGGSANFILDQSIPDWVARQFAMLVGGRLQEIHGIGVIAHRMRDDVNYDTFAPNRGLSVFAELFAGKPGSSIWLDAIGASPL